MSTETGVAEAGGPIEDVGESIRSLVADLGERASVRSVFGDPIEAEGRTVVPVARVAYGFGGGFGPGDEDEAADGEGGDVGGGGFGGGVAAMPVGVVEVGGGETRLRRFGDRRRTGLAVLAGLALGLLLGRRRYRSP